MLTLLLAQNGFTALMLACACGAEAAAAAIDYAKTEEIQAAFAKHSLLVAAQVGSAELVAEHIAKGADLAARDGRGRTALMAASEHGFPGIVAALLAAGAKPELADTRGRTALALA